MKRIPVFRRLTATVLLGCLAALPAQALEEGFLPLFNGKDLSGWSGDSRLWRVEQGEIVGSTEKNPLEHNSFLFTDRTYGDFELRVKVMLRNHNSGVQFRSEKLDDFVARGYQADVAEQTYFGMLYEEQGRGIMDYWKKMTPAQQKEIFNTAKQGDWNEYEIVCVGDRITMRLNGKTTCDIVDPDGAKSGYIGLQLHAGPAMEVRFKDISIKELAKTAASSSVGSGTGPTAGRGARFRVPEGFLVEEVATEDLTGSAISMTFDHAARPVLGVEGAGVRTLVDENGDGAYDTYVELTPDVQNVQGIYELEKGIYLIQGSGPEDKTGVFRVADTDGDLKGDSVEFVLPSDRGMGEHGPHAIHMGPDGNLYIQYGNHSFPAKEIDPDSPSRGLQEDFYLPRYWDPRGHAKGIMAPGGTIHRTDASFARLEQVTGGFRNSYDFDFNVSGEIFTFESDMEWDIGMPWFRPVRVVHIIPGGDYGWRSGSGKIPFYDIDTLPSVDDIGRGSPVGVAVYDHYAYPSYYRGALFMGDWSRGRVRVIFPQADGATFSGETQDFVIGEPLNVTDLDIGRDGSLYVTTGGRRTRGGLYRVRYGEADFAPNTDATIPSAIGQPMPRSAWGKERLRQIQAELGDKWGDGLAAATRDRSLTGEERAKALEMLQVLGPAPSTQLLADLASEPDAAVRAMAVFLLGTHPLETVRKPLTAALGDDNALVLRRACEALVRAGLNPVDKPGKEVKQLFRVLDYPDRFVRYAARLAILRIEPGAWTGEVLEDNVDKRPNGTMEGLLAIVQSPHYADRRDAVFSKLAALAQRELSDDVLLAHLRVTQLAIIRAGGIDACPADAISAIRTALHPKFPSADWRISRELQVTLAGLNDEALISPMLTYLESDKSDAEQMHTVYALRTLKSGWSKSDRDRLVAWFDKGWEMEGGASLEGYINNFWDATLEILPDEEKQAALSHREEFMAARRDRALSLMAELQSENKGQVSDLAQRNFLEIAEYLEYDPMAYRQPNLQAGERVFMRSRCADCHLFGNVGQGGGPDLTTVASRFTRRDMLEAIMYPNKVVSDQYTAVDIELKDGLFYTGMVQSEDDRTLTLLAPNGQRIDIQKKNIARRDPSTISVMPEGLIETMNFGQLVELIQFLESGSKAEN